MKQYLILGFAFIFILLYFLINNYSYAYVGCNNSIYPIEVTTLNLKDYLYTMNYKEVHSFCSYDRCYELKESNISKSIANFKKIYDKSLTDEEYLEVFVKGYPVTKIIVNNC